MSNDRLSINWNRLTPLAALGLLLTAGCASVWWNSFLDPSQVGNFHDSGMVSEIQQTISFRDTPSGVPGATDPTPEDLVQTVEEYQIGVGDQLSIRMLDFVQRDVESEFMPTVDELGYIVLPQLGWIYVQGMTARELRGDIIQRAKQAGIFREETEPTVVITFMLQQQRVYHIGGTIQSPGRYRIIPPDFRIREAINQAGGLYPDAKTVYVFRNAPKPKRVMDRGVRSNSPATSPSEGGSLPPVSPVALSAMAGGPDAPQGPGQPAPSNGSGLKVPPVEAPPTNVHSPIALPNEQELMEAVSQTQPAAAGPETNAPVQPAPSDQATPPAAPPMAPFIFVNNRFIEAPAAQSQPVQNSTATQTPTLEVPTGTPTSKPVDWKELASEGQQRVIRIPAEKLHNGDPNYNIVIKHDDWITVDSGRSGVFYVMGHVIRPGVFSLTGTEITLRQAIAAAGGLDALAWPNRCELTRRIDRDREETTQWDLERIMNGKDPDMFLKPDDLINIGTHPIAPLLATIRNSFRLTYGFGFVYDRNFGDIDSFSPQINPNDRRRNTLSARFPGLFP